MNRRMFIEKASMGLGAAIIAPSLLAQQAPSAQPLEKPVKPPPLASDMVRDFVAAGHNDLVAVKQMLAEYPNLLYATWDWGGGDFETALEGAGHVGDKEIANYLIGLGARPNIFVLTMLGQTAVVKTLLERNPSLLNAKGPHGFTLLHHARRGEEDAAELRDYLEAAGLKESKVSII